MKYVQLNDYSLGKSSLKLAEKDPAPLKEGEVRLKVHASTINPSDLMFLKGMYGIKKKLPVAAGFEGSGTVSESKASLSVGTRVAFVSANNDGAWTESAVVPESNCLPLLDSMDMDDASMLFVNPLTSYSMVERGISFGAKAFVQTAGASALGKMIQRLCRKKSIPLINIVRRKEQEDELRSLGEEYVLNSSDPKFDREFFKLSKKLEAVYLFEAVGGKLATSVFELMPYGSRLLSYGALSEEPISINPGICIFQNKSVEGYWLSSWMYNTKREDILKFSEEIQKLYPEIYKTKIARKFPISEFQEGLEYYEKNMSAGKVLFVP